MRLLLLAVALALPLAAACGSGSSSSGPGAASGSANAGSAGAALGGLGGGSGGAGSSGVSGSSSGATNIAGGVAQGGASGAAQAGSGGAASGSSGAAGGGSVIDASTLDHKLVMGYQGWFACPGDGSPVNRWVHWFKNQTASASNLSVDLWPDTSELDAAELFPTTMTLPGGAPAKLYSAWTKATVERHFRWMQEASLDGVMLQRFSSELADPAFFALRNQVTSNVRSGAEKYGRVFAVMYDVSGGSADTLLNVLKQDWSYLVNTMKVTASDRYLRHKGKPLLAIWGLGFTDRPLNAAQSQAIVDYFKTGAPSAEQVTLLGGVPANWRTLNGDSQTDPAFSAVYKSFDVLSPWAVGRYVDMASADNYNTGSIVPDLAATKAAGIDYLPVVFPGFTWKNLNAGPLNQIPRKGGTFYWHQIDNALGSGAHMLYGAMFDEVDEGTALFKVAPNAPSEPAQGSLVPLDADGVTLKSD
ncbi:MAG TPA: glycoside hydrolase family 71/99-like protein, partial [Polyangiaceae bacterium]